MKYKIIILTIERNKYRYENIYKKLIENGFDKNDIIFCFGIDYKNIDKETLNDKTSIFGIVTPSSVLCCALTHVLSWNFVSNIDSDYFIFLEDDAYIEKNVFLKHVHNIECMVTKNYFLNMSTGFSVYDTPYIIKNNFVKSKTVLSLECYILNKNVCKTLFDFFSENLIFHHIDFHLGFVLKNLKIDLYHYKNKITVNENKIASTMVENHDKMFILKKLKDKETYKELLTPLFQLKSFVFNTYNLIVFLILIIFLFFIYFFYTFKIKLFLYEKILISLTNIIILLLVYDF